MSRCAVSEESCIQKVCDRPLKGTDCLHGERAPGGGAVFCGVLSPAPVCEGGHGGGVLGGSRLRC